VGASTLAKTLQATIAAVVESHCPLLDTFQRPTPVSGHVQLNGRRI
jgi:hypothetical protein